MTTSNRRYYCYDPECRKTITEDEYRFSFMHCGRPFCRPHQKDILDKATPTAKELFMALKQRKVDCILEYNDGYKSIDISMPKAGLDIEVDGKHHLIL